MESLYTSNGLAYTVEVICFPLWYKRARQKAAEPAPYIIEVIIMEKICTFNGLWQVYPLKLGNIEYFLSKFIRLATHLTSWVT